MISVEELAARIAGVNRQLEQVNERAKQSADRQELQHLRRTEELLLQQKELLLRAQIGLGNKYNTDAWGYSTMLADHLNMRAPYVQYGLYATVFGSVLYGVSRFRKARNLQLAAMSTSAEDRVMYSALADATEGQLQHAKYWSRHFRARGIAAIAAAPIIYAAWRSALRQQQSLRRSPPQSQRT